MARWSFSPERRMASPFRDQAASHPRRDRTRGAGARGTGANSQLRAAPVRQVAPEGAFLTW